MESGHISVPFKTISFTVLAEVKMILLLLLLMSTVAVADGVEVIDYLGRAVQDVFSNSTTQRGKESLIDRKDGHFSILQNIVYAVVNICGFHISRCSAKVFKQFIYKKV